MDSDIARKAKRIAHARRTSVSALIEELLRAVPVSSNRETISFADRWTGKLRLKTPTRPDPRFEALLEHDSQTPCLSRGQLDGVGYPSAEPLHSDFNTMWPHMHQLPA
jgi:hypothetical protein